jgi:hypothetical protein
MRPSTLAGCTFRAVVQMHIPHHRGAWLHEEIGD